MRTYSETDLIADATAVLGTDVEVLAAGVFGLQDLVLAATAGMVAGGVASDALGGTADVASSVLGGMVAKKAYAESQGMTVQLVVAVTADEIVVLNRDTDGRLPDVVTRFDRASCEITIKKMGLSRIITLHDPASGAELKLTGTVAPFSMLAKADKVVLHLLSA